MAKKRKSASPAPSIECPESGSPSQSDLESSRVALEEQSLSYAGIEPSPVDAGVPPADSTGESTAATNAPPEAKAPLATDTTLRVDVALLDQLMNLVGELVLARNQVLQFTKSVNDSEFLSTSQRLNLITSELQESVMKTRMQPVSNVWSRFPRVVRDLARSCGKQVRIEMEGKETELDKTIIEAIRDPLTHIVRNAVDHGIETPALRAAKGKCPEGVLTLRAFHEGGYVIIEISDDGAGLNPGRIRAKAVQQGLYTEQQVVKLSEAEVYRLVFASGFSTADQVTHISGRGVGMDVVRSNMEAVGGEVDILSKPDEGCTIKIRIPLTLAIIPALIVSSWGQRFAVPQVSLLELVRVDAEDRGRQIEIIDNAKFYRLRGDLLPLVDLAGVLGLEGAEDYPQQGTNIVVVKADDQQFGLVVHIVHDTEEIVVKPLGKQLKDNNVFSGATIMGDGKVALIIDIPGLAARARIDVHAEQKEMQDAAQESVQKSGTGGGVCLLVAGLTDGRRLALPLSSVDRLERFSSDSIEWGAGRSIVQYRGSLLPLVDIGMQLGYPPVSVDGQLEVVVCRHGQECAGFIVRSILDIVEEEVSLHYGGEREGIAGTAVINGAVTDVLDLGNVATHAGFHGQQRESLFTEAIPVWDNTVSSGESTEPVYPS